MSAKVFLALLFALCVAMADARSVMSHHQNNHHISKNTKFIQNKLNSANSLLFLRGSPSTTTEKDLFEMMDKARLLEEDDETPTPVESFRHYNELYSGCPVDIAAALETSETRGMPGKLKGFGKRFAVCAILEVQAEKFLAPIRAITSVLSAPITKSVKYVTDLVHFISSLVHGKFIEALDMIVNKLNPTAPFLNVAATIVYAIGRCITDIDIKASLCALCAASLAHAVVTRNKDGQLILTPDVDSEPATEVKEALTHVFSFKESSDTDDNICALDAEALRDISDEQGVNANDMKNILKHVTESRVRQLRRLFHVRVRDYLTHPLKELVQAMTKDEADLIQDALKAIDHPSTTFDVPMSDGGYEVEDLTDFYFTNDQDPDLPAMSLRQCGRGCQLIDTSRKCGRETCGCTIA
eukprot:c9884_g1_i1.p1 GENE.c9884_g1_i1~~c9884_g1_i1.p1  ORF type:complete len:428 (+),score=129.74 c9884_g1_i1:51-1286(+)